MPPSSVPLTVFHRVHYNTLNQVHYTGYVLVPGLGLGQCYTMTTCDVFVRRQSPNSRRSPLSAVIRGVEYAHFHRGEYSHLDICYKFVSDPFRRDLIGIFPAGAFVHSNQVCT